MDTKNYKMIELNGYKIKVYSCGPDEISSFNDLSVEFSQVKCIAYSYEHIPYAGQGLGIIQYNDGRFFAWSMGHCSCYGPCDRAHCEEFSIGSLLADTKESYPELYQRLKKLSKKDKEDNSFCPDI